MQADVATGHERFRVVTTHFENEHPGVRLAQAAEVLAVPCDTTLATVVLGDFNSDGNGVASPAAYDLFRDAGFGDAWVDDHPDDDGITWGHDELLVDPVPFSTDVLDEIGRIDFVLYRGDVSTVESDRLGEVEEDMFDGLWPSDHAGVTATLRIR